MGCSGPRAEGVGRDSERCCTQEAVSDMGGGRMFWKNRKALTLLALRFRH
jgi:hypothetical protein